MTGNILFAAAAVILAAVVWLMLPLIARRDLAKMTPAEHGWYAKRVFPLMLLFAAFAIAGSLAGQWGWP
ncbi:hypothetical protein Rleg4DRAFT_1529 [Rhizobium leguminosarum bv. trifolii WSM2297]|uniref:Uncharacterized protein n=1 Tax=Rhizobium leguminosarum bv. trifolii WSM2297 TaxID=754762 RepID=J0W433_RHILT|nr:hypothetical protein [Rhizobium leguminosarum]EJC79923.1 hypothetical protein Rleg4DRAFT_1529 [Rhizobium leguminosarum bv. trifolii WSM2297]